MKAAFYYEPNKIVVEDTPQPDIRENEMLVQIHVTSICGTDMRIYKHGHFKIPAGERRVLGHETAGVIVKVGKLIDGYHEGMRVSIPPNIGCGHCEFCRDGYNNMCPNYEAFGISLDGGFEEYMRIPAFAIRGGNIFPIPDHISFEEAALTEPLSCCYNALRSVNTSYRDVVLVIGAGPIGAMHLMLSRIAGAKKIMVADLRQDRLDMVKGFGADIVINSSQVDLKEAVMAETQGRGADVIITALSVPLIQSLAVELLATHGRVNFFGGLGENMTVPINTNRVHYKGLQLLGTTGSSHSDYYRCLTLLSEGRVPLKKLVSATYPLIEINKGFEFAASGQGLKTMIAAC